MEITLDYIIYYTRFYRTLVAIFPVYATKMQLHKNLHQLHHFVQKNSCPRPYYLALRISLASCFSFRRV